MYLREGEVRYLPSVVGSFFGLADGTVVTVGVAGVVSEVDFCHQDVFIPIDVLRGLSEDLTRRPTVERQEHVVEFVALDLLTVDEHVAEDPGSPAVADKTGGHICGYRGSGSNGVGEKGVCSGSSS